MEQKVWKNRKKEIIQENQETGEDQTMKSGNTGLKRWWSQYYVYVISSLIILVTMLVVMVLKKHWPFGDTTLLSGDFFHQGILFMLEFKNKLANGESLLYTWNASYGTNYYVIIVNMIFNPVTLFYLFLPAGAILKASTFVYILNLILCNCAMLYYLSHRPVHSLPQNKIVNMLFSLSYALCIYMVSYINAWNMLISAVFFPLIILGLENFVANKGWKFYFVTLALSFMFNYYFTGLFCIFIILYYFTLEFEDFKTFLKKSFKILGMSVVAILISSVLLVPVAMQMLGQSYAISDYKSGIWFTTIFDIIKNFFVFNVAIDRGTAGDSYGEVNLYYGLLPLLLTTFYFLNPKIKRGVRLKKLCLAFFYLLAFDLNGLNYAMHLMHYPSWFPNRFSLFFTLFCIILAYEAWISMEWTEFKHATIGRVVTVGLGWAVVSVVCFAFAKTIDYQFTYYYSIMIFLFYMVAILFSPYMKGKIRNILAIIGCIELCLNFTFVLVLRFTFTRVVGEFEKEIVAQQEFWADSMDEEERFYRVLGGKNLITLVNEGMLYDQKGVSFFAGSTGAPKRFLKCIGVSVGENVIHNYTYNQASLSLLDIQYVYQDATMGEIKNMPDELYTSASDVMGRYELVRQQGDYELYENPTTLSLGYMINGQADEMFPDGLEEMSQKESGVQLSLNEWIEGISGVSDVIEVVPLPLTSVATLNGNGRVMDNSFFVSNGTKEFDFGEMNPNAEKVFEAEGLGIYDPTEPSVIRFDCTVEESGEYFAEVAGGFVSMGNLKAGEEVCVFFEVAPEFLTETGFATGTIYVYRFNEEQWQKAYDILAQQQLQIDSYTSISVDGTIQAEEEGILFTSIPYDENWHLYIDGEETEILPLWEDSFVAARLKPGEHTVHLEYRQRGLLLGGIISVFALGLSVLAFLYSKKKDFLLEEGMSEEHLETFYSEEVLENRKKKKKSSKDSREALLDETPENEMSVDEALQDEE